LAFFSTINLAKSWSARAAAALAVVCATPGFAATRGELDQTLDDLVRLLPGQYSSAPLVRLEEESGVAQEIRHPRVVWVLSRVDAPSAGRSVFLQQVRRGDLDGDVAVEQQRLLALRIDPSRDGIVSELRPLLAPEATIDAHRHPDRQHLLLLDPQAVVACDWLWRRRASDFVAMLVRHASEEPCPRQHAAAADIAGGEWMLGQDELAVRDAPAQRRSAAATAGSANSRPTWQRLFRSRDFGCSWLSSAGTSAPTTAFFEVHDRGGEYRVDSATGGALILRLMRGPLPGERLRGQRDVLSLAVVSGSSGRVHAESKSVGTADYAALSFADQRIECARR